MNIRVSYVHSLLVIIFSLLCIVGWGTSRFFSISWPPSPILSWILPCRKEEFPCKSWCCESWCGLRNWERRFRHYLAFRVLFSSYFKLSLKLNAQYAAASLDLSIKYIFYWSPSDNNDIMDIGNWYYLTSLVIKV